MATNTVLDRNSVLAARQGLVPQPSRGWSGGFGNMLKKELGEWFGGRRWLLHLLVWLGIINGFIAFVLFVVPAVDPNSAEATGGYSLKELGLTLYYAFAVNTGTIGMIIATQDKVIREKQSGTAAWILSKPAARPAFILAKLVSNMVGGLVFIAGIPWVVAMAESYLASGELPAVLPALAGLAPVFLALMFYLTLTLMLGTVFEQRGPLLGVALGVNFGVMILASFVPSVGYILPISLHDIATAIGLGQPLPAMAAWQMIATAAWSILFAVVALWRFNREEF